MTHVSLFSGAGISDWGFHQAGWDCLAQVEIDKQATNVRKRHFPGVEHHADVRSFDATKFRGVDAICGGFPCQDYSVAGKRAGLVGDRGALWWEFHRCIREAMPGLVVGENVPGILSSDSGRSFRTIVGSLVELGYRVSWRVLDLRYFRVPQRRRRVFIVGSLGSGRSAEILFEPDCLRGDSKAGGEAGEEVAGTLGGGSGQRGWSTSLDTCGTFVPMESACLMGKGKDSQDPTMQTYIAGTLAASGAGISRPAGNANETDLIIPMAFNWQSGGDSRGLDPTEDVSALSCHQTPAVAFAQNQLGEVRVGAEIGTLNQNSNASGRCTPMVAEGYSVRRLTPTECERLMGLPDSFTRWGADGKEIADGPRYKMLGNGWSVPQAEYIARRAA